FSVVSQAVIQTGIDIASAFEMAFLRAQQAWIAFKVLSTAGLSDTYNQELIEINAQIDQIQNAVPTESPMITFFDNLITKVSETKGVLNDLGETIVNSPIKVEAVTWGDAWSGFSSNFQMTGDLTKMTIEQQAQAASAAKERMSKDFAQIGLAARNGMGNAVGAGFAA